MKKLVAISAFAFCVASAVHAQPARPAGQQPPAREDALDPSPIDPATDPDLNMFINDWRNAKPRAEYGKLMFYDILTSRGAGDVLKPVKKGAVLSRMSAVSRVVLAPGAMAEGRVAAGNREVFIATEGVGSMIVDGKASELKDGAYFTLTPDVSFKMTNTGKAALVFYARTETIPATWKIPGGFAVINRYDNDRVFGAHWAHSCDMGPPTGPMSKSFPPMTFCSMSPYAMPQPHSHPGEEAWLQVEGETILSLGKQVVRLKPGQAYRIPPNGLAAHSNINLTDRMTKIIYLGPIDRPADNAWILSRGLPLVDNYSRLDNRPITPATEVDVDMYMGNWRDAFPGIRFGNLYVRDILTGLEGPDALHPTKKGAVLSNAVAVTYGLLEPKSSAHSLPSDPKDVQQTFVVNSGTGTLTYGGKTATLTRDMAFVAPPGADYKITADGGYMTFYVVSEKLGGGVKPSPGVMLADHRNGAVTTADWVDKEHALVTKADGLSQYASITRVDMPAALAMSRSTSAAAGAEEIWIATDGDIDMLFGKRLHKLSAGTAYKAVPDGITARGHLNASGKPASFLRIVK
jgi:mannose-6-phosphate isomerase-like protein (cupin superfamily)